MYKFIISSKPLHKHPNLKFMLHSWKKEEKEGMMLATQKAINMEVTGIKVKLQVQMEVSNQYLHAFEFHLDILILQKLHKL